MARLYYGFETNLTDPEDKTSRPMLDYIAFDNGEKQLHLSLSCNWESDFGIDNGRWKGVECCIETYDGKTIHGYEELTKEDIELLAGSSIYEIGIYMPEDYEWDKDKTIKASDIVVDLEFYEDEVITELHFEQNVFDVMDYL